MDTDGVVDALDDFTEGVKGVSFPIPIMLQDSTLHHTGNHASIPHRI